MARVRARRSPPAVRAHTHAWFARAWRLTLRRPRAHLCAGNPVGAVAFAEAARRFFAERIPYEERTLEHLFGDAWHEYKRRVPWSGVPFVR